MEQADDVEYRMLAANDRFAVASLFACGLRNTVLLQLARLATGFGDAFSVYAVYREGPMTFEASARLEVGPLSQPLDAMLRGLLASDAFVDTLLGPLTAQVEHHFAPQRR